MSEKSWNRKPDDNDRVRATRKDTSPPKRVKMPLPVDNPTRELVTSKRYIQYIKQTPSSIKTFRGFISKINCANMGILYGRNPIANFGGHLLVEVESQRQDLKLLFVI